MIIMPNREKSNLYPNSTWEDCLEFIKVVSDFCLSTVSYSEVAKKYGLSSIQTKSFTAKISTAKQFGLITTSSGAIQLTQLAKDILYPTGDITALMVESFRNPPLYEKLIAEYDGKALPTKEIFENILMSKYKITKSAKSSAAQCFFTSADQLGIIKGGIFAYSDTLNQSDVSTSNEHVENNEVKSDIETQQLVSNNLSTSNSEQLKVNNSSEYIVQNIPVSSGKVARIEIPIDAEEDDLWLIKDMLDVVLKRKFKLTI